MSVTRFVDFVIVPKDRAQAEFKDSHYCSISTYTSNDCCVLTNHTDYDFEYAVETEEEEKERE